MRNNWFSGTFLKIITNFLASLNHGAVFPLYSIKARILGGCSEANSMKIYHLLLSLELCGKLRASAHPSIYPFINIKAPWTYLV